jgi:hypothetical protein
MQVMMSAGTAVLGLALVFLASATSPELALFGWVLAGLGILGVVLRFVMPSVSRDRLR